MEFVYFFISFYALGSISAILLFFKMLLKFILSFSIFEIRPDSAEFTFGVVYSFPSTEDTEDTRLALKSLVCLNMFWKVRELKTNCFVDLLSFSDSDLKSWFYEVGFLPILCVPAGSWFLPLAYLTIAEVEILKLFCSFELSLMVASSFLEPPCMTR